ncbi:MAG: hypothetical protein JXB07_19975 [Anaerolineae bacterium]|nr:hypothetical protein [Anaerolineae bacterium]
MNTNTLDPGQPVAIRGPRYLTANEETMRSWAMWLHSIDEVPDIYRDFFAGLSLEPGTFPYTVLMPSYKGSFIRAKPKLICLVGPDICIVEQRRNQLEVMRFPCADINYIESGNILLRSWLKISGITQDGLRSATLPFNTVTQSFLDPFIETVRAITPSGVSADFETERAKFYYLLNVHFKFMNYAQRSILPGEQVITSLVQQEIRTKVLKTFYRAVTPAHISILTDQELILITEDRERFTRHGTPYGGIWYYIPLRKIAAVSLTERDEQTLSLSVRMSHNDQLSSIFDKTNQVEVESLVGQLKELIAQNDS